MKTILEIQKLDAQIKALEREVDKCPASLDYKKYKTILQNGRDKFAQLDAQANEIINNFNIANNRFPKYKGNSDIIKKKNTQNINLENINSLLSEANSLIGDLTEENKRMEDLVRKSEEIVRRSKELSQKLNETKTRSKAIKEKIEAKKQEIAPKIAEINKKIKSLEPKIEDKANYAKYNEMKENGIFPVFVKLEDVFCGGCKVELSLNFIEKLKTKKMLPCEHCGRMIMLDK